MFETVGDNVMLKIKIHNYFQNKNTQLENENLDKVQFIKKFCYSSLVLLILFIMKAWNEKITFPFINKHKIWNKS